MFWLSCRNRGLSLVRSNLMPKILPRTLSNFDILPKTGLVDDHIRFTVSGLKPFEGVTLLSTVNNHGDTFAAIGNYIADKDGEICSEKHNSLFGTYRGGEPEGLIWSMKPLCNTVRHFTIKDVEKMLDFKMTLYRNNLSLDEILQGKHKPAAEVDFQRGFQAPNVSRKPVNGSKIRGCYFEPKDGSPYRPIIDISGGIDGFTEHRAALLASKGFAVLALAHYGYQDLPKNPELLPLEYFKEAIDWVLNSNNSIDKSRVCVVGSCIGAYYALAMAEAFDIVKTVVSINGILTYPEKDSESDRILDPSSQKPEDCDTNSFLNIEKSKAKFLFLAGELDKIITPRWTQVAVDRLKENNHKNFDVFIYPGAGHFIEPPFLPFSDQASMSNTTDHHNSGLHHLSCGGITTFHAHAQYHAWFQILRFLQSD